MINDPDVILVISPLGHFIFFSQDFVISQRSCASPTNCHMCLNHDYSDGGGNNSNENFMISQTSLAEVTASLQLSHDLLLFIGTYRQMGKMGANGQNASSH